MAETVTPLVNTDPWQNWFDKTNQLVTKLGTVTVTVNATSSGALTTGNGYVNGYFGGLVIAANTLLGGSLSVPGPLYIGSNVVFNTGTNFTLGSFAANSTLMTLGSVTVNSSTMSIGANLNCNTTTMTIGNTVSNTTTILVGANVSINATTLAVGANLSMNVTTLSVSGITVNSKGITAASNVALTTAAGLIANNTIGNPGDMLYSNGTTIYWAPSGGVGAQYVQNTESRTLSGNLNFTAANLTFGTMLSVGAVPGATGNSVSANTTALLIGNSSVYTVANSTAFTGSAATLTTARSVYGSNFDGSAGITGPIIGTYGGTGINNGTSTLSYAGNIAFTGAYNISIVVPGAFTYTLPAATTTLLSTGATATLTAGFTFTPNAVGIKNSGTYTPDPTVGNYQYYTANGVHTLAAPASDCAIDLLITNGSAAGAITWSGFTPATPGGDAYVTTNTNKFILSILRINGIATASLKALQ